MECGCLMGAISSKTYPKPLNANLKKQESDSERQKQTAYTNSSHVARAFEVLDSLRKNEVLCDIKLQTEDGTQVFGHKVVLASATPYFQTMFTSFEESKKNHVTLLELDPTTLKLIVDFIYTGQIMVTEDNVKALLSAANLLQLHDVKEACCDFLQTQLNPKNCLSFKALIFIYDCVEYLSSFKSYILQNFSKIVESDKFLNLLYDELVEIISCDELNSSSEEKVFECVVNWVNHDLSNRKDVFPKLMKHVRLRLVSKKYLCTSVGEEPLVKSSMECRDYLQEALYFHILKSEKPGIKHTKLTQTVKKSSPKVILIVSNAKNHVIQWFDSAINRWQLCPEISIPQSQTKLSVFYDRLLFYLQKNFQVHMSDLFSPYPCIKKSMPMLKERMNPGVGVLDNCIYAIGGHEKTQTTLKCAEVFDFSYQNWRMISEMSTARRGCSVGVLDNHIYAVGGSSEMFSVDLKSVERYCPKTDTWTPVADMNKKRRCAGIGILNGVMYAIGGCSKLQTLKSVEAYTPSSNTWTFVSDMNKVRGYPRVVAFNGLLYVVGNENESNNDYSAEMYDPKSNIWTMLSETMNIFDF